MSCYANKKQDGEDVKRNQSNTKSSERRKRLTKNCQNRLFGMSKFQRDVLERSPRIFDNLAWTMSNVQLRFCMYLKAETYFKMNRCVLLYHFVLIHNIYCCLSESVQIGPKWWITDLLHRSHSSTIDVWIFYDVILFSSNTRMIWSIFDSLNVCFH